MIMLFFSQHIDIFVILVCNWSLISFGLHLDFIEVYLNFNQNYNLPFQLV